MKTGKELTMIWQGLLLGALYALAIFTFCAFCAAIIYLYLRRVDQQLFWGFLSATGVASIIFVVGIKFSGKLNFFRQIKTKLKI
jgi:hypothetical protein